VVSEQPVSSEIPRDTVEVLRAAAEGLRRLARDLPRGPWRWGDPDVGDEPGPVPVHEPWTVVPPSRYPKPFGEPEPVGHRDPFAPFPDGIPPLRRRVGAHAAGGLDVLASRVERDERAIDPETARAAVAVARVALRSCARTGAGGRGEDER
jgi:hypothetical protein